MQEKKDGHKENYEKSKGTFIVFEGGEGSGKTSVMNYIVEQFPKGSILTMREPGGTPVAEKIRKILLDPENSMSPLTELFLFGAGRASNCDDFLRPMLAAGKTIMSDRFDGSSIAYQIFGRKMHEYADVFKNINSYAKGRSMKRIIRPDLVLFFDVDPKIGLARAKGRLGNISRFDDEELAFHERVREGFIHQHKNHKNWTRVDANKSEAVVRQVTLNIIKDFLKQKGIRD